MTVVYLSGPMTGKPQFNFPAFHQAANRLRAAGYHVLNPADNWGGATNIPRAACMRLDISQLLCADGVALLDGWRESKGARLEIDIAHELQLHVMTVDWWLDAATSTISDIQEAYSSC